MQYAKRWIALLLALVMTAGTFPAAAVTVSAEETGAITEETQPVQTEPAAAELPETVPTVPDVTLAAETIPAETEPAQTVPETTAAAETVPETTVPAETVISQTPAAAAEVLSGTCGENLTWTLDDEGTLTISGTGAMTEYGYYTRTPWYSSYGQIKKVVVEDGVTSICEHAFYNCDSLTDVVIGEGVTVIREYAFGLCDKLVNVTLPSTLQTIGDYSFGSAPLSTIALPEGLMTIGKYAFEACRSLTDISLPSTVTSVGEYAFKACVKLSSVTMSEGLTSIGNYAFRDTALTAVVLPASLTSLGVGAFNSCDDLTTINLPAGLTEIPESLFNYCGKLTSIVIPEGVTTIGANAFNMCQKLAYVTLPSTLKVIGDYAFNDCQKMTAVTLPEGLTTVGKEAFDNCESMATLVLPSTLTTISENSFRQCRGLTTLTIPGTIGVIPKGAFGYCQYLVAVTIGEGITEIGEEAFTVCSSLREVTIPSTVTSIGAGAFTDCDDLTAIHVAEGNETFASQDGVLFTADMKTLLQYPAAKADEEYVIPASVTALSEKAFYTCQNLKKVTIHGGISVIPFRTFWGSWSLTEVVLSEGITEIGGYAFNSTGLTGVTFPESLTTIGEYAFYGSDDLATVSVGKNVTSIGDKAFGNSENMEAIYVAEDNPVYASDDGVLMNKAKTAILEFPDGKSSYTVPATVTELASDQFSGCQKLTSVVLHDGITKIPMYCFQQCQTLTDITLGAAVTEIGYSAFNGCAALTSITIPASVTIIGNSAFTYCSNLKEIHFLGDAPTIAADVFGNVYNTSSKVSATAYYPGDNATWTEDKLQNYGGNLIWRVEGAVEIVDMGSCGDSVTWTLDAENTLTIAGTGAMTSYNSYRMVPWDQYRATVTKVVVEEGVTSIGSYAFYNMPNLTEVTLPNTLVTIEQYAFRGSSALESIVIPDSVTTIGAYAFAYCNKLANVTMGSNITSISGDSFRNTPWYNNLTAEEGFVILGSILMEYRGEDIEITVPNTVRIIAEGVFRSRDDIVKVVLPETVTEIHKDAFYGCTALKDINIPAGVKQIGEQAFYRCTSLESIDLSGITQIGNQAFYQCEALSQVTFGSALQIIGSNAFSRCYALNDIILPESLETLDYNAFANCTSLTAITIPNSLESTGNGVFSNCTALKTVNLGTGLREIATSMFANCTSLEYIHIPLNIAIINNTAFQGCKNLSDVDFAGAARGPVVLGGVEDDDWWKPSYPDAGTALTIKNRAFADCTSLVDVYLPSHLTELSSTAFRGASNTEFFHVNSTAYFNDTYGCVYEKNGTILVCVPAKLSGHYIVDPNATEVYADFYGCADLEGITFSTGAGGVHGEGKFAGCTSLVKVIAGKDNKKGYSNDNSGALLYTSGSSTYICFIPVNLTSYTIPANVTNIYSSALANVKLDSISVAQGNTTYSVRDGILYSADGKTLVLYPGGKTDTSYVVPVEVTELASGSFAWSEKLQELWFTGEPVDFRNNVFGGSAEMMESGGGSDGVTLTLWYPENIGPWYEYSMEMGYFFGDNITMKPYLLYTAGEDDAITVEAGKPLAVRTQSDITTLKNVYVDDEKVKTENYTVVPNGNFILFADSYLQTILLGDHSIRLDLAAGSEEIGTNDPRLSQTEFEEMLAQAEERDEPCYLYTEVILERNLNVDRLYLVEEGSLVVSKDVTLTVEGIINMEDGGSLTILEGGKLDLQGRINMYYNSVLTNQGAITIQKSARLQNYDGQLNNENEITVYGILRNNRNLVNDGTIVVDGSERNGLLENNGSITNNGSILLAEGGRYEGEGSLAGKLPAVQEAPVYRVEITGDTEVKGGDSIVLTAELLPENETNTTIEWSVSDSNLATLKVKGNTVTLKAADVSEIQKVELTAESADGEAASASVTITIIPKVKSISIWPEGNYYYPVLTQGRNTAPIQLNAEVAPAGADSEVIWTSSDEDVATVSGTGLVTFTNETGDVTITATSAENSKVKATIDYKVIEPVIMRPKDNKTSIELVGGKSETLTILDGDGNKVKNLYWEFVKLVEDENGNEYYEPTNEFDAYASISSSGKLTAKKVVRKVELGVRAMAVVDGVPVGAVVYDVTIYPQVSQVEIVSDNTVLDWNVSEELNLTAALYPTDVADEYRTVDVKWDVKGNMVTWQENGNRLKISLTEHKAGTVTVKATAQDGSKKSATLKIQVGAFADKITIDAGGQTELKSNETLTMTAAVRGKKDSYELSNPGVTWSLSKEDKAYATLSVNKKTGEATLKAKSVYTDKPVTVIATSKDGMAVGEYKVTIKPSAVSFLTIQSLDHGNVTKDTVTLNLEKGNPKSITLYAADYASEEDALSGITWSPNKDKKNTYTVSFDEEKGTMILTMLKGGTVKVTAKTADKKSATVTIKASTLSDGVKILSDVNTDESGRMSTTIGSGKSITLKAEAYAEVGTVSNKKVTWSLAEGHEAWAKISSSGKLTAVKNLTSRKTVTVQVQAQDGASDPVEIDVTITPAITSLEIRLNLLFEGKTTVRTEKQIAGWANYPGEEVTMSAVAYPTNADQRVEWKSSNENILKIDPVSGKVTFGTRGGTVTITATSMDGSNKKATFKLKVLIPLWSVEVEDQDQVRMENGVIAGGKTLKLSNLIKNIQPNATSKKLFYEIVGGDGAVFASVDKSGNLKTQKVTGRKTVNLMAYDEYGFFAEPFTVTICPATTWIDLTARRDTSSPFIDVTNQTIELPVGEILYLRAGSLPGDAWNIYKWEVKNIQHGGFVMEDDNLAGGGVQSEVRVMGDTVGKTLTVTATAMDGTNKKAAFKIKIVDAK